jgi:hypothetical protein
MWAKQAAPALFRLEFLPAQLRRENHLDPARLAESRPGWAGDTSGAGRDGMRAGAGAGFTSSTGLLASSRLATFTQAMRSTQMALSEMGHNPADIPSTHTEPAAGADCRRPPVSEFARARQDRRQRVVNK